MKNRFYLSLIVVALLCMAGWNVYAQRSVPPRQTWEYKVDLEAKLDLSSLGAQGWELVTAVCLNENAGSCWLYLKRPR